MNTLQLLQDTLVNRCTLFGFEYCGKEGSVDPFYEHGTDHFLLYFGEIEKTVDSFDEVLHTPFINGKSLIAVLPDITITDF